MFRHTQVVPETGKLTIFSNTKLTHSVNMIKENTRYILALWFTNDFCDVLLWGAIPFVLSTIYFGVRKGENVYYDSDNYDGNGTAH